MKKLSIFWSLMICALPLFAQRGNGVEMADVMQSSGKIYVVVGTIAIVFLGLMFYLFNMDRNIRKLEKDDHR